MNMTFRCRRRGLSIIEVLVVLAVVGILVALLLPAVLQSRRSAREVQCLNNLRQIGLALHSYHAQFSVFPPAAILGGPPGEPLGGGILPLGLIDRVAIGAATAEDPDRTHANWLVMLLPYLDEGALYNRFDANRPISDPANKAVREASLPVLKCSADNRYNRAENPYVRDGLTGGSANQYARGSYAMNFGPNRECIVELSPGVCTDGFHVGSTDLAGENSQLWGSGVGGFNRSFSLEDITAGQSNVVAVDEIRAGPHPLDPRGTWALGFAGASITARHGLISSEEDAYGPNNQDPNSDDIVGCTAVDQAMGPGWLASQKMPCYKPYQEAELNDQATARSQHDRGVHVMTVDGAAHFVSDSVSPVVWFYIHDRQTTESFDRPF